MTFINKNIILIHKNYISLILLTLSLFQLESILWKYAKCCIPTQNVSRHKPSSSSSWAVVETPSHARFRMRGKKRIKCQLKMGVWKSKPRRPTGPRQRRSRRRTRIVLWMGIMLILIASQGGGGTWGGRPVDHTASGNVLSFFKFQPDSALFSRPRRSDWFSRVHMCCLLDHVWIVMHWNRMQLSFDTGSGSIYLWIGSCQSITYLDHGKWRFIGEICKLLTEEV